MESVVFMGRLAQFRVFTYPERTAIPGRGDGTFLMVAGERFALGALFSAAGLIPENRGRIREHPR